MPHYAPDSWPELLFITAPQALAVVISTVLMYLTSVFLMRVLGQRAVTGLSTFDVAAVVVLGAITGRATMGHTPTLAGGIIALVTLFSLQAVMGMFRLTKRGDALINNHPVVLMSGKEILMDNLHHNHLTEAELWTALRTAGVRNDDEIAAVILEPTGQFSVMRRGFLIDRKILVGVRDADKIAEHFIAKETAPPPGKKVGAHDAAPSPDTSAKEGPASPAKAPIPTAERTSPVARTAPAPLKKPGANKARMEAAAPVKKPGGITGDSPASRPDTPDAES